MEAVQIGEKLGFNFFFFYRWGEGKGSCSFCFTDGVGERVVAHYQWASSQCHMNVQRLLHSFYSIKFTMTNLFVHWTLVHNALYLIISDVNDERQHYDLHWGPTDLLSYNEYWGCPLTEWPILQWSIKASVNTLTDYLSTNGWLSHNSPTCSWHSAAAVYRLIIWSMLGHYNTNISPIYHQWITNRPLTYHWHLSYPRCWQT